MSNKNKGFHNTMINIEKTKDCSTAFFLLKNCPKAKAENIVTALVTDADMPANTAKNQRNEIIKTSLINLPLFRLSRGLKTKESSTKIIPTCNPDIAKI